MSNIGNNILSDSYLANAILVTREKAEIQDA